MTERFPPTASTDFDVIVIGAGINGAGIARDAAMRGLKVLLLDKGDIASGTSAWSTRLIHGGLRYLEHGEVGLVRESLRERETLLRIAPHLVRALPILVPVYKGSRRGRATIRAGLFTYDLLSFDKGLPRHRMLSRADALKQTPGLNPDGLLGAATFYDAQVEFAERLVLENVLAAVENSATVITYARVDRFIVERGRTRALNYVSEGSGESCLAQGKLFVNAAGPWVDKLLEQTGAGPSPLIGGTKGSHLVVPPFVGAPSSAVYVEAETDHRPFFIIPWNGNYLIGTTDIRFEDDLDQVRSEPWEIDYLLSETNRVFPGAQLTRDQVLYTYSGVRPLAFTSDKDEQSITRRHFIRQHPKLDNLLSIVGGKLTTYRSLAEECVDLIFQKLQRRSPQCATAQVALPGALGPGSVAKDRGRERHFPEGVSDRLLRIYGTRAETITGLCAGDVSLSAPFNKAGNALAAEVVFSFKNELAKTLVDCLMRRTMIGLNSDLAIGDDERAAEVGRQSLGWSDERAKREVAMFRSYVDRFRVSA